MKAILATPWRMASYSEIGIPLLRIWLGILMIKYSYPVVLNNGFSGFGGWLNSMSIPLPHLMAYLAKGGEFVGGILLVMGLFTRPALILIMINMIVATLIPNQGLIFSKAELPFTCLVVALAVFLAGPGKWSIDETIAKKINNQ